MLKATTDRTSGGRKLTFTLPAGPEAVSVVGNFNDWTPGAHPLRKRGATRSVSVVVPANYIAVFRYLGEGDNWFDEPEASYVDNGASVLLPPTPTAGAKATAAKTTAAKTVTAKTAPAKTATAKSAPVKSATAKSATAKAAAAPAKPAAKTTKTTTAKATTAKATTAAAKPAAKTSTAAKSAAKPASKTAAKTTKTTKTAGK